MTGRQEREEDVTGRGGTQTEQAGQAGAHQGRVRPADRLGRVGDVGQLLAGRGPGGQQGGGSHHQGTPGSHHIPVRC